MADVSVSASFAIDTFTLDYIAGANGSLSGDASQVVDYGASGTPVSAVADLGYHFVAWSPGGSTQNPRTDTNVPADVSVTASFAIDAFTVTPSAGAGGSLIQSTPQTVGLQRHHGVHGHPGPQLPRRLGQRLRRLPARGHLHHRPDHGRLHGHRELRHQRVHPDLHAPAPTARSPALTPDVNHGADGTLVSAVADAGYHFVAWSDGVLTASRTDLNVTANITVSASFAINVYTLTYSAGANGSISGTTPQTVNHGADGTLVSAVADAGYHFVAWSDGVLTASRTDLNVTANITVSASFAINTYTNSTITGTSPVTADGIASSTVTITLKDALNNPVSGVTPTFSATDTGAANVYGACSLGNASGVSTCTLKSTKAEIKTLKIETPVVLTGGTVTFVGGAAFGLAFVGQPTSALPGAVLSQDVTVQVIDAYSNPTTAVGSVTLTLSAGLGSLSGTATQPISGTGLATFDDLSVSDVGTYTLTATSTGLAPATSSPFLILPATGGLLANVASSDADFNHLDGFDVLFAGASSSAKKLAATNPGTFHYELDLQNETGVTIHKRGHQLPPIIKNGVSISDHNGASTSVIITVPSLPTNTGLASVPGTTTTVGSPKWAQLPENSAFMADGSHSVRAVDGDGNSWDWSGHWGDHGDDIDVSWARTAPGGNCLATTGITWISGQPTNNAIVKCVKVEGLDIPKHHASHIQISFEFALKGSDAWAVNATTAFRAGFPFKSQTQVKLDADFPIASLADKTYVGNDVAGLSGAGEQITAIGGFVFDQNGMGIGANNIADNLLNATIRLYNTAPSAANRCTATGMVAETTTDGDGFYFLWKTGIDQSLASAPNLPSGVRYYVMVCDVTGVPSPYWPARSIGHTLANKEFEEENFYVSNPTHLGFSIQPTTNRLGRTMYPVQVALLDQWNNLVVDSTLQVTLSIDTSQGGTLSGTKIRTMFGGYATFSDLKISGAGTTGTYTLLAVDTSPPGLGHPFTPVTSLAFTMTN